jgi:hypothetical protein
MLCGPPGLSWLYRAVGSAEICTFEPPEGMVRKNHAKRYEPAYGPFGSAALRTLLSVQHMRAHVLSTGLYVRRLPIVWPVPHAHPVVRPVSWAQPLRVMPKPSEPS